MTGGEHDKLHEMNGRLGGVEAVIKHFKETWQEQDRAATEGRRMMYEAINKMAHQQSALTAKVEQQTQELAEVKPAIQRFEAERQRQEGAASLFKVLWMGVVAFATGLGYAGHELLQYFWPPKH